MAPTGTAEEQEIEVVADQPALPTKTITEAALLRGFRHRVDNVLDEVRRLALAHAFTDVGKADRNPSSFDDQVMLSVMKAVRDIGEETIFIDPTLNELFEMLERGKNKELARKIRLMMYVRDIEQKTVAAHCSMTASTLNKRLSEGNFQRHELTAIHTYLLDNTL